MVTPEIYVRVLLAGAATGVDEHLLSTLEMLPGVDVMVAEGFDDTLAQAARAGPDVVVVPFLMDGPFDGLQLTSALRWTDPSVAVLVASAQLNGLLAERALLVGAAGLIAPDSSAQLLDSYVRDAALGYLVLDEVLRDALTLEVESHPGPSDSRLLELIAAGRRTVHDLSEALGRSWRDVERMLAGIERRLGLAGRVSLLLYADAFHRTTEYPG